MDVLTKKMKKKKNSSYYIMNEGNYYLKDGQIVSWMTFVRCFGKQNLLRYFLFA